MWKKSIAESVGGIFCPVGGRTGLVQLDAIAPTEDLLENPGRPKKTHTTNGQSGY